MIVTKKPEGTKINEESVLVDERGGGGRAARLVKFFDFRFGGLFLPEHFTRFSFQRHRYQPAFLDTCKENFVLRKDDKEGIISAQSSGSIGLFDSFISVTRGRGRYSQAICSFYSAQLSCRRIPSIDSVPFQQRTKYEENEFRISPNGSS